MLPVLFASSPRRLILGGSTSINIAGAIASRIGAGQDDRHDPRRFRQPLSVKAFARLPEGTQPADPQWLEG
jgi:hypothetical protein